LTSPTTNESREAAAELELELLERVAHWMDRRYLDPILGFLLPGAGDVLASLVGALGILVAFRLRAHPVVIARMFLNLALDSLLGAIPFVGDVIDIFYRAHTRNLILLRDRDLSDAEPSDWLVVGGAGLLFLMAMSLPILAGVAILRWLWTLAG
jgi:hypothetical protein